MNSLMRLDKEYNWINKKRNAQKKKKYTKFHKIRASFSLTLFIHLDIEDTLEISIGKNTY